MSNFCRITGHTRGLPKTNHFFPILPPISPAEAKKYRSSSCRITSNYNPNHNYVPIKSYLDSAHVSKCQITRNSLFKYKHYQFISPVMTSKSSKKYFYVLDSKVLLLPDEIEMQMSKGIITDVQISNHTIGFKYNYKVKEYDLDVLSEVSEDNLIFAKRAELDVVPGAGLKVVKKRRVGGKKRRGSIALLTSVFEDKEKRAELEQIKASEKICPDQAKVKVVQGRLEEVKRKKSIPAVHDVVSAPSVANGTGDTLVVMGDDDMNTVSIASVTFTDQIAPSPRFLLLDGSTVDSLEDTSPELVKGIVKGDHLEYGKVFNGEFTPGQVIKINMDDGTQVEKFIPGRMVDGHFTPGQLLEITAGQEKKFIPGQVMEIQGSKKFVPGQLVLEEEAGGAFKFVPGRILEDGEFHPGEIVETGDGLKFVCDKIYDSDSFEFELQTFEMENPILFEVEDVKRLVESIVPVEFPLCCNVLFEQAVFEKKVDERVIHNVKEWVKEHDVGDLLDVITFARRLGNEAVAEELEGVLHSDEETKQKVLSDPSIRFLLCQLVVLKGMMGNEQTGNLLSSEVEFDQAVYKSNVVAKVLLEESASSKPTGGSSAGSVEEGRDRGSSVGSGDDGKQEELASLASTTTTGGAVQEGAITPMEEETGRMTTSTTRVVRQSYAMEEVDGAVVEFASVHSVTEEEFKNSSEHGVFTKRQRLAEVETHGSAEGAPMVSIDLDSIVESVELLDTTPAKHKLSLARQLRKKSGGGTGERRAKIVLKSGDELMADSTLVLKNERDLILYELIETEEEFVRDLEFVMGTYYKEIEASVKFGNYRDLLFEDFKAIYLFHKNSLVEAIRYYQDDPVMIAKSFLRLERDFEPHVRYYQDHLKIDEVISNDLDLLEFIEDLSVSNKISDSKSLTDHLKLPLQRINDYVLIFKDLLDVCSKIHDDPLEREVLSRVLEFLVAIPQKLDDRKFLNSIEGIDSGVLGKLGRLYGHGWFVVTETHSGEQQDSPKNRYVFLFKQKILVTKVKRISDNRSVFVLKQALHLPDYVIESVSEKSFKLVNSQKSVLFETSGSSEDIDGSGAIDTWVIEISKWTKKDISEQIGKPGISINIKVEDQSDISHEKSKGVKGIGVELLNVPFEEESVTSSSEERTLIQEKVVKKVDIESCSIIPGEPLVPEFSREDEKGLEDTGISKQQTTSHKKQELFKSERKSEITRNCEDSTEKSSQAENVAQQTKVTESCQASVKLTIELNEGAKKAAEGESDKVKAESKSKKVGQTTTEWVAENEAEAKINSVRSVAEAQQVAESKTTSTSVKADESNPSLSATSNAESPANQIIINPNSTKEAKSEAGEPEVRSNQLNKVAGKTELSKSEAKSETKNTNAEEKLTKAEETKPTSASVKAAERSTTDLSSSTQQENLQQNLQQLPPKPSRHSSKRGSIPMADGREETPPPSLAQLTRRRSSVIVARQSSTVESNLKITEPIQSAECEPGDNASFRLTVSSTSTIITWLKGNRPLDDKLADRVKIESKGNTHSLTLLNSREDDASLYTAKVCEIVGDGQISEPVSCSAYLVVHELTQEERAIKAEQDCPQFLVKFKDTELLRHTTVNFLFLIKGKPEPEVVFKRNDSPISSATERVTIIPHGVGKYELRIEKIEDSDAGTYTVIASNKHGIAEVNAVVKVVGEKDVFNEGTAMRPDETLGGSDGDRKGLLEPGEEPMFTWFKDGQVFEPGEDFKVLFKDDEDTLALVFQHVKPEDAGLYTCVASTTSGRISCSAELTVQGGINQLLREPLAPCITAALTDTEVSVGGSAMLELKVTGFPKPQIQWFKEDEALEAGGRFRFLYEDEESIALIVKNVTYDDEGTYKVVATNDLGDAITKGKLLVRQPPRFIKKMSDMSMMAGEAFTIVCEVEGNPKPELKWYKDGVLIVSSERIKFVASEDGQKYSMLIERVTLDDTGAYSVVASNAVGQMSEFWNVLATMPARFTERLPGNVVKDKGEAGGEYVVKVAGVPDPTVAFKLDGKEIKSEKIEHNVYKVKVGELTEKKDYELVATATNKFAKDESVCLMNVKRGVKIVDGLKDIIVKEHGEATVGVKVDCFPKPTKVKWFIDGVEIGGGAYEQKVEDGNRYTLTIKDAYKPDSCRMGVKVMIDNGLGEDESSATITMQAPPIITKGLAPLHRLENDTIQELSVTLRETTPVPTGIWYHNGKEVSADARIKISKKSTENYTLTFDCVKYEDAGEWAFKAVNDIGEVWTRTTVIVEDKPQFTSPLPNAMRILETETYDLEVNILDYCEENVKIEWKSDVETVFKPIIASDRDGDQYHSKVTFVPNRKERYFKVVATNKYGESESICQIDWIELVPPKILTPLKDTYTIQDGDSFHFESEVEGVPKPRIVWLYNGEVMAEGVTSIDGKVDKKTIGEYTLHAVNVAGEAKSSTKLQLLQEAPRISPLKDTIAVKEAEEDLVLSVEISGSPIPTVTWLHAGVPIDLNDPRVSVETTPNKSTLIVKNAAKSDKGPYSVKVTNLNGEAASQAVVDVTYPPEISGKLTHPDLVTKGSRFEVKGQVSGEPVPDVSWIHPTGAVISESEPGVYEVKRYPDGTVVLAIESAQMTDGGIYKLVAKNSRGEASLASGIINVEAARSRPRINPPLPAQIKLIEGQPLTLRTTVKAHPIPELALKFEDSAVPFEQRTIENGLEFEHKWKAVTSSGTFVLTAKNSEGATESECKLIVVSRLKEGALAAPTFIQELTDKKINEGGELVLIAKVDGNPIPEVEVLKDGVKIPDVGTLEFDGSTVKFRLDEVRVGDAGEYSIQLVNSEGDALSKCSVAVNKIYKAPEFMQKFSDQAQLPSRDCKFGAKISGVPTPTVRWLKDGKELDLTSIDKYKAKIEDDTVALQVRNCTDADIGVYTCELSNVEGKAICNAKLDVVDDLPVAATKTEAPYFLKTIGSTEVYPGMQSKFTACIGGIPEPEFEWFRDGNKLHETPGSRLQFVRDGIGAGLIKLIINDTNIGDLGEYKLRIFNDLGEASCSATLKFDSFDPRNKKEQSPLGDYYKGYSDLRPTALPDKPVITRMDEKSLTINWKPALPNVHSKYPCTYLLEMSPADSNDWKTVYSGLKNCFADVDFPSPTLDYKFRVRVQWGDKFTSEPSPYCITNRNKLNLNPPSWQPMVVPSIPRSYDLTRPPHPNYTHPPRFLNPEREIQYVPRNTPATVHFSVYGYPKPTLAFRFNGSPINLNHTYLDNGLITLFLNEMNETKIGTYECTATNPHGVATQPVDLRLTEYPWFLEHLKETHVCARKNGRLHCIVSGLPCPTIRLFKDWHPSGKQFQVVNIDETTVSVTVLFEDALLRDEGLYSIVATNQAGSAHSSATLRVHEDEHAYNWLNYGVRPRVLRLKRSDPNDYYHFGELIGRGTQGGHYHVVETRTGTAWAAKRMTINEGNTLHRSMIETEIDNWANVNSPHVVRLYDGFYDNRTFVLVNELCNGGDLFGYLVYELEEFDEDRIRGFMRQIITGVRDLHEQKLWICGLQPLDILLTHKRSNHIKLTDFGLSRFNDSSPHRYSHPEFASPELISFSGISGKTDIWSIGVIAHILLTGHHPYVGLNDQETMENLKNWNGELNMEYTSKLSSDGVDFLRRLLRITPGDRMSACEALDHAWFKTGKSDSGISLFNEGHVKYYNHLRGWQSNANCLDLFRRNPLEVAYKHPSKMVYPPGYDWVEEREFKVVTRSDWEFPRPTIEIDDFVSESHYQSGDDTYLLQLRDTDFPARLRQYMKVAASQSPSFALHLQGSYFDLNAPVIRERRKFTDIMDEEVDDERRARIVEYGEGPINSEPRRLRHEVGTRLDIQAEAEAIMAMKREGREPCLRERPSATTYIKEFGVDLTLTVIADGEPGCPDIQWFKNDTLLQSNDPVHRHRLEVTSSVDNTLATSALLVHNVKNTDLTNYKVTARNKIGQVTWKFRVAMLPETMLMPRTHPPLDFSKEKNPVGISTNVHAYENVSSPEIILKGSYGNVLRSGENVYKICSNDEYDLIKGLVNTHVLGGEYSLAIQVGNGVALCYEKQRVLLPLLEHVVELGSYTEQTVVNLIEQVLHGLSYLHWSNVGAIGLGPGSIAVEQGTGKVRIVDLSGAQRISRVGVGSELVNGRLGGRLNLGQDLEFVAPECLSTEGAVTGQCDIWSAGVLIYLLLSGVSPFKGGDPEETKQNILFVRFRFEHLYKDLSQEATRLIMLIFKRSPLKRPSSEECFEHRWFHPTESLTRKRQRVSFGVEKIQAFLNSLNQDQETSSTSAEYSNNLLNDFYRAHQLL